MEKRKYKVGIFTLSDKGSRGEREDVSGPKIQELLSDDQYEVVSYRILPDEQAAIEKELCRLADEEHCALVLTTGGTGFSVRDVTPEATLAVADRVAPGIAEAIRAYSLTITPRAMLSRAASAIRKQTLIVNLPGSPKAVEESLTYILSSLGHGLDILLGEDVHGSRRKNERKRNYILQKRRLYRETGSRSAGTHPGAASEGEKR